MSLSSFFLHCGTAYDLHVGADVYHSISVDWRLFESFVDLKTQFRDVTFKVVDDWPNSSRAKGGNFLSLHAFCA